MQFGKAIFACTLYASVLLTSASAARSAKDSNSVDSNDSIVNKGSNEESHSNEEIHDCGNSNGCSSGGRQIGNSLAKANGQSHVPISKSCSKADRDENPSELPFIPSASPVVRLVGTRNSQQMSEKPGRAAVSPTKPEEPEHDEAPEERCVAAACAVHTEATDCAGRAGNEVEEELGMEEERYKKERTERSLIPRPHYRQISRINVRVVNNVVLSKKSPLEARRDGLVARIEQFIKKNKRHPMNDLLNTTTEMLSVLDEEAAAAAWESLGEERQNAFALMLQRFIQPMRTLKFSLCPSEDPHVPVAHFSPTHQEPVNITVNSEFCAISDKAVSILEGRLSLQTGLEILELLVELIEKGARFDRIELDFVNPLINIFEEFMQKNYGAPTNMRRPVKVPEHISLKVTNLIEKLEKLKSVMKPKQQAKSGDLAVARASYKPKPRQPRPKQSRPRTSTALAAPNQHHALIQMDHQQRGFAYGALFVLFLASVVYLFKGTVVAL